MSRRIRKAEEIRNHEHYFNRFIALEVERDQVKQKQYNDMFDSLDEMLAGGSEGVSGETVMLLATNIDGSEFEASMTKSSMFGWIDYIDNSTLYRAIMALPDEDKYFLTLRFRDCLTQGETAEMMQVVQSSISRREKRLKKYFRDFFEKAHRKP